MLKYITLLAVLLPTSSTKTTHHYIPLTCMSRFVIHDWGKCKMDGDRISCPNVTVTFVAGCETANPKQSESAPLQIERPGAVLIEDSNPKEKP